MLKDRVRIGIFNLGNSVILIELMSCFCMFF